MNSEFEHFDLRTLMDIYMKASREFSSSLEAGASWQVLQEKRQQIRYISALINKKYDALYGGQRLRNQPPHGD